MNIENKIISRDEYLEEKRNKPYHERFRVKKIYKPAKDKEQNKIERLNIRVSKDEKEKIYKAAEDNNMSISDYILTSIGLR